MSTTRRDFLLAAAGAPLAFELCGCSPGPSWLSDALRAIRAEGKPGLVFRLPADPKARCRLGHNLAWLVERTDPKALAVTLESVLLCLEHDVLRRRIDGARDEHDLILIDGEGVAKDGAAIDSQGDVAEQAAALLAGPRAKAGTSKTAAVPAPAAPRLPYGVSIALGTQNACKESPGCMNGRGCGPCGMAVVTPRSQGFVKFLAG